MTTRAGEFNKRVTFQKPTITNTNGEVTTSWSDVLSPRVSFMSQSGNESYRAKQIHNDMTHLVKARHTGQLAGLNTTWRIKFGSRFLNIVAIENVGELNFDWLITCKEAA